MLVNALYFKGQWVSQFDKDATAAADFDLADGKTLQAAMMTQKFEQGRVQVGAGRQCTGRHSVHSMQRWLQLPPCAWD